MADPTRNEPIAITGMHRSGTSMITRGLHGSGLHLVGGDADALLDAAADNPEGFWENKAIVACNDDLLEAAGGAWDNPPELLPQAVDDPRLAEVIEPATAALTGLAENPRWGFKDPRLCLTAAFWLDLRPDLRFVICVRNPLEVALSLKRRNQNSYSLGLALWERYYRAILDLVPADRRIVTHYDNYFIDPVGELGRVCEFAGLQPQTLDVRSDLRHHDVGVSLDEANLGDGIRSLYRELCAEAGAALAPPSVADEGQIRRLVLDGAVAARHAAQRQDAISRLEERLAEARESEKAARAELAGVRRESEARRVDLDHVRGELARFRTDTAARFETLLEQNQMALDQNRRLIATTDTVAEMGDDLRRTARRIDERQQRDSTRLEAVHVKLRAVEDRLEPTLTDRIAGRVRRIFRGTAGRASGSTRRVARAGARRSAPVARRTAKAAATRLPGPARNAVRRVRRSVADGQASNRVRERAERAVSVLPGPAQTVARKGGSVVRRSGAIPKATRVARGVNRRLPASARRLVDRVAPTTPASGRSPSRPVKKAGPPTRPKAAADGRAAAVPKGPAAYKWQKGYERLVAEFVAPDQPWMVVTPGCRSDVGRVGPRAAKSFPSSDGQAPAADSLSLIAILASARATGFERLVLPEGARAWYAEHPELRDHVARSHPTLADREGAGAVFDLAATAPVERRGLLAEINDLVAGQGSSPAVLDWTDLDIAGELPGFTTFLPPESASLPYFDDSIDIVVVAGDRDRNEAERVARVGVVSVGAQGQQVVVESVRSFLADGAHHSVAVMATPSTAAVDAAVATRVAEAGASLIDVAHPIEDTDADIVVVLERGVVPLPGAIDAAARAVLGAPGSVTVAKVIDTNGRIESAGGIVFSDGTAAGIAGGTLEVRAPWHEYARPVCWGAGLIAVARDRWDMLATVTPEALPEWCASVWAAGTPIQYQPRAAVVRVDGAAPSGQTPMSVWSAMLDHRPPRPSSLSGDGVWRYLLAVDDPAALKPGADD